MTTTVFTSFQTTLRKLGFVRTAKQMGTDDTGRRYIFAQEYTRDYPADQVRVVVQLCCNGQHSVSHWHPGTLARGYDVMDTTPTPFTTVDELTTAIEHERTRYLRSR